jgi:hypothetical protein
MKYLLVLTTLFFLAGCFRYVSTAFHIERVFINSDNQIFSSDFLESQKMKQIDADTSLAILYESVREYKLVGKILVQYATLVTESDTVLYYHYYYLRHRKCQGIPVNRFEPYFQTGCTSSGFARKSAIMDRVNSNN